MLASWGSGGSGCLGLGTLEDYSTPQLRALEHDAIDLCCGGMHTLAVAADGRILAWGSNSQQQLGLGGAESKEESVPLPRMLPALSMVRIVRVRCGWTHSAAISAEGSLYTWGDGRQLQLGHGSADSVGAPKLVEALGAVPISEVACGWHHTVALSKGGALYAWGCNRRGQLGLGDQEDRALPTSVTPQPLQQDVPVATFRSVSCGWQFTAGLDERGRLFLCGDNKRGQLAMPPERMRSQSHLAMSQATSDHRLSQVSCGWTHVVALTEEGQVLTWGRGDLGQLGNGRVQEWGPLQHVELASAACLVAAGSEHCLAQLKGGGLYSWGWNEHGNLGHGHRDSLLSPALIKALEAHRPQAIATGGASVLCLLPR